MKKKNYQETLDEYHKAKEDFKKAIIDCFEAIFKPLIDWLNKIFKK